ncbi:MAG: type II secretion system protein GspG, partial [Verrucomicrobiota bacterium]
IGGAGAAQRKAAEAKARSEISKFEIAAQQYKRDHGHMPQADTEITRGFPLFDPSNGGSPYLNLDELRFSGSNNNWMDPFGSPYRYKQPGDRNPESYDVWSFGADGDDGTADDIGNFSAD